ncbi:hypothetical protein PLCT2_02907 [Planctomycetaceae bacterium]|nr:hypothetical protein PLCT2_02907 [Planctomycetaceae bacterium]
MDPLITTGLIALLITVIVVLVVWMNKGNGAHERTNEAGAGSTKPAMEMREMWLCGLPAGLRIEPINMVLGMIVDLHVGNGTASLVAIADGSTSLYFSSGGGVIGAGEHPQVRQAKLNLLNKAAASIQLFLPAANHDLPAAGRFRFYVQTTNGLMYSEADQGPIVEGKHALSELFSLADHTITETRLVSEARGA